MRISDVAKQTGIPVSTIRYYEKRAIISKPYRDGRNRSYSAEDVRAIRFVRDAQSLGLPLKEIAALVQNVWDKGEMASVAKEHRKVVQARIEALHRVDKVLSVLQECTCRRFADCNLAVIDTACCNR